MTICKYRCQPYHYDKGETSSTKFTNTWAFKTFPAQHSWAAQVSGFGTLIRKDLSHTLIASTFIPAFTSAQQKCQHTNSDSSTQEHSITRKQNRNGIKPGVGWARAKSPNGLDRSECWQDELRPLRFAFVQPLVLINYANIYKHALLCFVALGEYSSSSRSPLSVDISFSLWSYHFN
jgi:hypothetical protein